MVGTSSSVVILTVFGRPIVSELNATEVSISLAVPLTLRVVPVVTIPAVPLSAPTAKVTATPATLVAPATLVIQVAGLKTSHT